MVLKSLELYNCLGILNGIGQEKIFIDFSQFKSGLILIQGKSGTGKSTLLNNCQPYRNGFKENFESDGYRYLDFEYKGHLYTSQVYQTKAMLFKDGKLLNPTQKVKEYDEVLEEELGSPDAFFKLLFAGRRFKNILDLTKGERKDLIVDYLLENLKKYEVYQTILKGEYNEKVEKIREAEIRLERIPNLQENENQLLDSIELLILNLTSSKEALAEVEIEQSNFLKQEEENKEVREAISKKEKEKAIIESELVSIEKQIKKLEDRKEDGANEYDSIEYEFAKLESAGVLVESIEGLDADKLQDEKNDYNTEITNDEHTKEIMRLECEALMRELLRNQETYFKLKEEKLPCTSQLQVLCPLTKNRDVNSLIEDLGREHHEISVKHALAVEAYNKYTVREFKEELEDIEKKLEKIRNYNKTAKLRADRETLTKEALRLKEELESLKTQLAEKKGKQEHLSDNLTMLEGRILEECQNKAEELANTRVEIGKIETKIAEQKDQLKKIQEELEKLEPLEKQIETLKKEAEEYPLLIEFFGNNGAKVFDLQNAGNQISDVANNLLANYSNKNVKIKFETLGVDSKGGLKEVFDIQNSMDGGEWKTYASDGESVIISNAIREAMCYLRQNHDMKTVYVDELDGSIDSMSRVGFIKLLEQGAELNQRHHTFLISHSEEVKSFVEQKIIFEEGEIKVNG